MTHLLEVSRLHVTRRAGAYAFRLEVPGFVLPAGAAIALLGKSGSGKSTLLDLLALALPPDGADRFAFHPHGEAIDLLATWRGGAAVQDRTRARHIGYVLQTGGLLPFLTVRRNIALPAEIAGRPDPARVEALARRLGVAHHLDRMPHALSVGERQRVAIARALVTNPSLILADEPTANLDSKTGADIIALMHELNQTQKTTFIFSTHDSMVMTAAQRIVRIADGKVVTEGAAG
jgi:putative ABC transport system ATP-binding protein